MNLKTIIAMGGASIATLGATALLANAQLGPLDPPAGVVSDTSPSLEDLQDDIAALSAVVADDGVTEGPWESLVILPSDPSDDQTTTSLLVAEGNVLLHRCIVAGAFVVFFDGNGSVQDRGRNPNGDVIAHGRARGAGSTGSGGLTYYTSVDLPLDVRVSNGLHVCWDAVESESSITILYKPLP